MSKEERDAPKIPKSPVWMMAFALASLARSFKPESRPRMSAIQRIRPCTESITFVCVFTCVTGGARALGLGETPGRVEVEVGRVLIVVLGDVDDDGPV